MFHVGEPATVERVVINRGNDINMSAKLVEASDMFAPLSSYEVALQFHETWLSPQITDGEGFANFTFNVPYDHPLGLIVVQMVFNGSTDLLSTSANLTSITVRSLTFMVVDSITANPVAGTSFNISGQVVSDNGSGLVQRDNSVLPNANVLFSIDGQPTGFTATGGSGVDGYWNATIRLSETSLLAAISDHLHPEREFLCCSTTTPRLTLVASPS